MSDKWFFRPLASARRGTVALEFAFVGSALLGLVVGTMHIGFSLYAQSVLDQAAAAIARDFQTGTTKNVSDPNSNAFKTIFVCPALHGMLDCASVSVINYPVSDYKVQTSGSFSPGGSRSLMLLKLVYTSWIPSWPVLNGLGTSMSDPMLITATVPYVNEF